MKIRVVMIAIMTSLMLALSSGCAHLTPREQAIQNQIKTAKGSFKQFADSETFNMMKFFSKRLETPVYFNPLSYTVSDDGLAGICVLKTFAHGRFVGLVYIIAAFDGEGWHVMQLVTRTPNMDQASEHSGQNDGSTL